MRTPQRMDHLLVDCGGQGEHRAMGQSTQILVLLKTEGELLGNASFAPGNMHIAPQDHIAPVIALTVHGTL
jgi:hypothetical protein